MKQKLLAVALFLAGFLIGSAIIGEVKGQGVAPYISLWLGTSAVSATNPLPVQNQ